MGACLSIIINACNEIVRSTFPSTQQVPVSEEIAPSAVIFPSNPTTMASTSSSIGKYDVFINHRGIDVKNSLASTIYHTLDMMGVRAFLDREELEAGEEISHEIKEAIWSASVHIAIFSQNYAQSRWCLDELTWMLETGKKIIPVFYHVEPSHLRWVAHGTGVYSKAFSKHKKDGRYKREKLEEWKMALSKASQMSGYEFNERQNDQGLLLSKIVNTVKDVMNEMKTMHVATHPVGLDEAIQEFQDFVETRSQCAQSEHSVKIVGIVSLGGCGKTTLVKEYFNHKRSSYTASSFLCDVREAAKNSLHNLQKKLLEDLVHFKEAKFHHTSEGKRTLEHRVGSVKAVKALIVLDDVDHIDQMEALLPLKGNLQPDSLIIVTTRDSGVIASSASLSPSVSVSVYQKRGLDPVHAKQLFCWHAFLRDSPEKGFEDLVEKFLKACHGLPLSLKVLGAQFYGNNDREYWDSVLHKISNILPDKIKERLAVSYDALDKQQQQMFLDVACFFIGKQKDMVISIWDGSSSDGPLWSGCYGFQILANKCLVDVDHENRIRMHDHLRDLGREIAIEKKPSRFWSHSQFVNSERLLEERLPIRGIMAATGSSNGYCDLYYEPPFKECMQLLMGHSTSRSRSLTHSALGLQLLIVRGDYFKEQFAKLSEQLAWLRWYDFPHGKVPSWLSMENLRVLELFETYRLAKLWGPNDAVSIFYTALSELYVPQWFIYNLLGIWLQPPSQLRELIIKMSDTCNLQMIPETIGVLKHLKKIVLNKNRISCLPGEFCHLESLEHLELRCSGLSSLPTHFGKLRKLKYINLSSCVGLTTLPVSFNQLTELQHLDLSFCGNLHIEKDILENIRKLQKLNLNQCLKLQQLPSDITRQMYLRKLKLLGTGLRELPADIDRLANLEVLEIGGNCWISLPNSLQNLSSLIKLRIFRCRGLEILHLTRLKHLVLSSLDVEYLPEGFEQHVNLQYLDISHCPIRELPLASPEERHSKKPGLLNHVDSSMFKFPWLKWIYLFATKVSTISISEDCCPCLEDVTLLKNEDLMEIETLPTKLKRLNIYICNKLENIRGVAGLAELQELDITECSGLDELPSFAGLVELQWLHIEKCLQLHMLPSFAGLVKLQVCCVSECPEIDELPSFACCTCLESLIINVSSRLTKIEGIEELRSVERLYLETSWKVPGIKSLKNLDKLTTLRIRAERRSAIETCIPPNIVRCGMEIVGMAAEDVDSVVGSLSFPNLTVVDKLHSRSPRYGGEWWVMETPLSNASCVIGCFVISCCFQEGSIRCDVGGAGHPVLRPIPFLKLKGKQVYISVWPKGFHLNEGETEFLSVRTHRNVQIHKVMAVIMRNGEEEKSLETLHKFLELLER